METSHVPGKMVELPTFSENKLTMLKQLADLAAKRVPNDVWYAVERRTDEAARTVTRLIDMHMSHEESARYDGEQPMKFIDFITLQLANAVVEERQKTLISENATTTNQEASQPALPSQTADDVNRLIRAALGNQRRPKKRQYSNTHFRKRR